MTDKPNKELDCARLLAVGYVVGLLLTFGHEGVRFKREATGPIEAGVAAPKGLIVALGWPIYWPLRCSWEAFDDQ